MNAPTFACGHSGAEGHSRLCSHLVGAGEAAYARVLRGQGLDADLCCADCAKRIKDGRIEKENAVQWLSVCEACVELFDENEWDLIEWIGQPGIEEQLVHFNKDLSMVSLPHDVELAVALVPLDSTRSLGFWNGALFLIKETGIEQLCEVKLPVEKDEAWCGHHLAPRLHVSPNEHFAVLCHDYGRFGVVVDLQEKRVTMSLDKGDYRNEHTPFAAAFFMHEGRTLLVHATNWNRLDVSDPLDGTLLSAREFLPAPDAQTRPEHYLDFWHGQLHVSPDARWIADDGWSWAPVGVVALWSIRRWMEENVWESEDGVTRRPLCGRHYLWNIPIAWVDAEHVAVWGIGPDDEMMLSGARVFDVSSGQESATFAGPSRKAFFGGKGRLFSVEDDGLHIWNATTGVRLGRIEGFKPAWQRGDCLIELNGATMKSWDWRTAFIEAAP